MNVKRHHLRFLLVKELERSSLSGRSPGLPKTTKSPRAQTCFRRIPEGATDDVPDLRSVEKDAPQQISETAPRAPAISHGGYNLDAVLSALNGRFKMYARAARLLRMKISSAKTPADTSSPSRNPLPGRRSRSVRGPV